MRLPNAFQDVPDAADKGAGGDAIFTRDFSAPTGEDKMDKSVLPKARPPPGLLCLVSSFFQGLHCGC